MESEQTEDWIKFYRVRDKYGEFSNFYHAPIEIDGKEYPTTEHYFQAMKFYPDEEQVFYDLNFIDGRSKKNKSSKGL